MTEKSSIVVRVIGAGVALVVLICAFGFLASFKGVDQGQICVVREGGPLDGRGIKDVRQPGTGIASIGIWNHQDCLPTTERDSNDVIEGEQTFPTRDSVQVIVDGQALFSLTTDEAKIEDFYKKYGRRKWGGESITGESGWLNFLRQRVQPVILDAQREAVGSYNCDQLNNLCRYVQNPEQAVRGGTTQTGRVDNSQNLAKAQRALAGTIRNKLRAAFGSDFFENVRYQNLRIRFEKEVQSRITEAQSLRTQAANATLEAQRKVAEAQGEADRRVAEAQGARRAAFQQRKAYEANPTQRDIDKIKAFCGSDGCDPRVVGGSLDGIIADISK